MMFLMKLSSSSVWKILTNFSTFFCSSGGNTVQQISLCPDAVSVFPSEWKFHHMTWVFKNAYFFCQAEETEATMVSLHSTVSSWMSSDNFDRHPDFTSSSKIYYWTDQLKTLISVIRLHTSHIFFTLIFLQYFLEFL